MPKNRFFSWWIISLGGTLSIIVALYMFNLKFGVEKFSTNVSLPLYSIIPGILVISAIWAFSRNNPKAELSRTSLFFLTISFCFWFLAEQTWNLYQHVLMIDPYPSIADVFYLLAPVFMFLAIIVFLKNNKDKISKKNVGISCFVSILILIPSLIVVSQQHSESEPLEIIIGLAYPVIDSILLIPVIISILFILTNKKNFFWIMILIGITIMLIADNLFLFLVIKEEYSDGHPIDILWLTSYTIWTFMMFYSIIESKNKGRQEEEIQIRKERSIEKYGVLIILITINMFIVSLLAIINQFDELRSSSLLEYFSYILIVTVIIFSSMVLILNSKLNQSLTNKTKQLEETSHELVKSERFSAIGELASRISHDIRNPLSNIQMSIELIKKSPSGTKIDNDLIQDKINLISKNVDRISHQVNNVLSFIKNQPLEKKKFKVSTCIKESLESIKIPTNIKLKITNSSTIIFADPFQLQIVFNNILMNAIQSIGEEEGEIKIKALDAENETIVEFINSGPEIPEEILPHIFDSLVTTKQVGTGLGLVSCKTIIENHGGSIYVKNNPTTFTINIPK